jgi:hypothetical protein
MAARVSARGATVADGDDVPSLAEPTEQVQAPSSSGAMVTIATASWLAAMTRMMSSPENASVPGSCPAPLAGLRRQCAGCAPFHAGLMKLLSRWAGSTRAEPGTETTRAAATARRNVCRSAGAHATDVGQNAVTP